MAISIQGIQKNRIVFLRELPRDIFDSREAQAIVAPLRLFLSDTYGGIGLDLDITNAAAAVGAALVTIDKVKTVTLAPGTRFTMENVLYAAIEITRVVAGNAPNITMYFAGVSFEVMSYAH